MNISIPCRVGDMVWGICRRGGNVAIRSGRVKEIYFSDSDMIPAINVHNVCTGHWGKNVFGTEDEAWEAIAKSKNGVEEDV